MTRFFAAFRKSVLLLAGAVTACSAAQAMNLIQETFDSVSALGSRWSRDLEGDSRRMGLSFISDTVRAGGGAARLTLDVPRNRFPILRNELRLLSATSIGETNKEYTYTFSQLVPTDWPTSPLPVEVAQFHVPGDPGEVGRGPVLAFTIVNGEYKIVLRWHHEAFNTAAEVHQDSNKAFYFAPLTRGAWTDWRVNVRWSWGDPDQPPGFLKIWKNGVLVVDRVGPNCYNDRQPRYFKWGLYTRAAWARSDFPAARYTIYVDEMHVAEGSTDNVAATAKLDLDSASGKFNLSIRNDSTHTADIVQATLTAAGRKFDYVPAPLEGGVAVGPSMALAQERDGVADNRASLDFTAPLRPGATTTFSGGGMVRDVTRRAAVDEIGVNIIFSNGRSVAGKMAKQTRNSWVFAQSN